MNSIRSLVRDKSVLVPVVSAFLVGTIFGLVALGWYVFPVNWYNTDLEDLRPEHLETYLELLADSFAQTNDLALAVERVDRVRGTRRTRDEVVGVVDRVAEQRLAEGNPAASQRLSVLAAAVSLSTTEATAEAPKSTVTSSISSFIAKLRGIGWPLGIAAAVIVLGGSAYLLLRTRVQSVGSPRSTRVRTAMEPAGEGVEVIENDFETAVLTEATREPTGADLGYYQAVFHLGDDDFDAQFAIQGPDGEFLGECGMGAREALPSEEGPQRVSVFEIWLFDKNDIRTVIGMLASEYVYKDEELRTSLTTRGKVAVALPGGTLELMTAGLRLRATIRESSYGRAADAPPRSFFSELIVDLRVDAA